MLKKMIKVLNLKLVIMQEYQNIKTFLQITQNNLCYLKKQKHCSMDIRNRKIVERVLKNNYKNHIRA